MSHPRRHTGTMRRSVPVLALVLALAALVGCEAQPYQPQEQVIECALPAGTDRGESACMSIFATGMDINCYEWDWAGSDVCWLVVESLFPQAETTDGQLARELAACYVAEECYSAEGCYFMAGFGRACGDIEAECVASESNASCTFFEENDCLEATRDLVESQSVSYPDRDLLCGWLDDEFNP